MSRHTKEQRWLQSNGKAMLRWVSAYLIVSTEAVRVLASIPLIKVVADGCKMVYSAT